MLLFCEDDAVAQSLLKRGDNDERDNEIGARDTDGHSNATAHICDTARGSTSRRTIGWIPDDRGDLGDLRFAVREAEIGEYPVAPRTAFFPRVERIQAAVQTIVGKHRSRVSRRKGWPRDLFRSVAGPIAAANSAGPSSLVAPVPGCSLAVCVCSNASDYQGQRSASSYRSNIMCGPRRSNVCYFCFFRLQAMFE